MFVCQRVALAKLSGDLSGHRTSPVLDPTGWNSFTKNFVIHKILPDTHTHNSFTFNSVMHHSSTQLCHAHAHIILPCATLLHTQLSLRGFASALCKSLRGFVPNGRDILANLAPVCSGQLVIGCGLQIKLTMAWKSWNLRDISRVSHVVAEVEHLNQSSFLWPSDITDSDRCSSRY